MPGIRSTPGRCTGRTSVARGRDAGSDKCVYANPNRGFDDRAYAREIRGARVDKWGDTDP